MSLFDYVGEKMKPAFDSTYPKISPKRDLEGEVLIIQEKREIDTAFGHAVVYEAIRERDGEIVAFTGGEVLDKQDLERNDRISLKLHKGKKSNYLIAEAVA